MKTFFSLVLINLIIFGYSLPAYLTNERTKKTYERSENIHRVLRFLDDEEERVVSHGEDTSDNKTEPIPIPDIIPSGNNTEKPTENTQILTFANYKAQKVEKNAPTSIIAIKYTVLIFFLDGKLRQIVKITLRVYIITRRSRIRNLEEAEDIQTTCILKGSNGDEGVGAYDCEGETKTQGSYVEEAEVNINVPMVADNETLPMKYVAFTGAAAEIGKNLHNSSITIDSNATLFTLKEGKIEDKTKTSFKVSGTIKDFNHDPGHKFKFTFHNKKDDENI